jgi:hypothetical protein
LGDLIILFLDHIKLLKYDFCFRHSVYDVRIVENRMLHIQEYAPVSSVLDPFMKFLLRMSKIVTDIREVLNCFILIHLNYIWSLKGKLS